MKLNWREQYEQEDDQRDDEAEDVVSVRIAAGTRSNDDYQFRVCRSFNFFDALCEVVAGGVVKTRSSHWKGKRYSRRNREIFERRLSWHATLVGARQCL